MLIRVMTVFSVFSLFAVLLLLLILSRKNDKLEEEKEKNKKAAKVIDAVIKNKEAQKENEKLYNAITGAPDNSAFDASIELLQKCSESGNTRNK